MSDTPRSDAALARFGEFCTRVQARLESGKRVYGDSSLERPLVSLIEEIRQEVLDQAGWAFLAFERLADLEGQVQILEARRREAQDAQCSKTRSAPRQF